MRSNEVSALLIMLQRTCLGNLKNAHSRMDRSAPSRDLPPKFINLK